MHSAVEIVNDALREAHMRAAGPLPAGEIGYLLRSGLDPTSVDPAGGVRSGSLVQRLGLVPAPAAGPMSHHGVGETGRSGLGVPPHVLDRVVAGGAAVGGLVRHRAWANRTSRASPSAW